MFCRRPPAAHARAAINSIIARIIADGVRTRGLAAPIREHLGIDFARSWALAYLRAATPAVLVFLALLSWGLSGTVLIGLDQRAVYERFGAPVAVLHPGLHFILPWPMGQLRRVEFGTIHDATLAAADVVPPVTLAGAEALPPPEADRLWEQAHPGELLFLIASQHDGQQTFQVVSADIKLRYRVGLTDPDALRFTYGTADPAELLRASAGRAIGAFLAGRTLDAVLGENREAMADGLAATVQRNLDGFGSGLQLTGFVIEAIHPPAGAAQAYHYVQAAEIQANARISAERGQAIATRAKASQYATDIETQAQAAAAETIGIADADLIRFTADHASAIASPESFLLERRLSDLAAGLSKSSITIIDHRIPAADAPVLDLRPLSAMTRCATCRPARSSPRCIFIPTTMTKITTGTTTAGQRGRRGSPARLLIAGLLLGCAALAASAVMVSAGQAVVVTAFGDPVRVLTEPGLAWKIPAPVETTTPVDLRLRTTSTGLQDVGTRDGLRVLVQAYVAWQVPADGEHVRQFLRAVRNDPDEAARQLRSFVGSALQVTASSFDLADLVNSDPNRVRVGDFEARLQAQIERPVLERLRHRGAPGRGRAAQPARRDAGRHGRTHGLRAGDGRRRAHRRGPACGRANPLRRRAR